MKCVLCEDVEGQEFDSRPGGLWDDGKRNDDLQWQDRHTHHESHDRCTGLVRWSTCRGGATSQNTLLIASIKYVSCGWLFSFIYLFHVQNPSSSLSSLSPDCREVIMNGLCLNTTASLSQETHHDGTNKVIGNKTEGAMLLLVQVWHSACFQSSFVFFFF